MRLDLHFKKITLEAEWRIGGQNKTAESLLGGTKTRRGWVNLDSSGHRKKERHEKYLTVGNKRSTHCLNI